jgi:hypothetical protein
MDAEGRSFLNVGLGLNDPPTALVGFGRLESQDGRTLSRVGWA